MKLKDPGTHIEEIVKTKTFKGKDYLVLKLSLIHISEPTRPLYISYAVFCLKKKKFHRDKLCLIKLNILSNNLFMIYLGAKNNTKPDHSC